MQTQSHVWKLMDGRQVTNAAVAENDDGELISPKEEQTSASSFSVEL